jgi:glycosyltransferase involved in cell wall biosynthesis
LICPQLIRDPAPWQDLRAFLYLWWTIKQGKYEIVHTHSSKSGILARWAAVIARVPVIVHTYHGVPWVGSRFYQFIEALTARITDRFIALSNSDKDCLLSLGIGNDKTIHVIPNGLYIDELLNTPPSQYLRAIGIPSTCPVVGMAARLKPQKDPELFVQMAAEILQRRPKCHFVVVGDGELRSTVVQLAEDLKISKYIHFLGWRDDVWEIIQTFNVFVLTSKWEGLPIVLIEATVLGVPVVATNMRGNRDMIINGETGLLAPPNPKSLAEAVIKLLNDSDLCHKLTTKAKEYAINTFDIRQVAMATEKVYSQSL